MNKKILIVDDESAIIRLLSLRLKHNGYEIMEAQDGLECIEIASRELPDLILMDIQMPKCDGINAFDRLMKKDSTRNLPVLFMTAFPKVDIINKVKRMGAKGCISKPFVSKDFEDSIRTALS